MNTNKKVFGITGSFKGEIDFEKIRNMLMESGCTEIEITPVAYDDWLAELPKESISGLREACLKWIMHWGSGGGSYEKECCVKEALEESESDVPAELADAVYCEIVDEHKREFDIDAITLIMDLINGSIEDLA